MSEVCLQCCHGYAEKIHVFSSVVYIACVCGKLLGEIPTFCGAVQSFGLLNDA